MDKITDGFKKQAAKSRVNYLDLFGLRKGKSKVMKSLTPAVNSASKAIKSSGSDLSKHTQQGLKGSNVANMSKSKWQKMMGLN